MFGVCVCVSVGMYACMYIYLFAYLVISSKTYTVRLYGAPDCVPLHSQLLKAKLLYSMFIVCPFVCLSMIYLHALYLPQEYIFQFPMQIIWTVCSSTPNYRRLSLYSMFILCLSVCLSVHLFVYLCWRWSLDTGGGVWDGAGNRVWDGGWLGDWRTGRWLLKETVQISHSPGEQLVIYHVITDSHNTFYVCVLLYTIHHVKESSYIQCCFGWSFLKHFDFWL